MPRRVEAKALKLDFLTPEAQALFWRLLRHWIHPRRIQVLPLYVVPESSAGFRATIRSFHANVRSFVQAPAPSLERALIGIGQIRIMRMRDALLPEQLGVQMASSVLAGFVKGLALGLKEVQDRLAPAKRTWNPRDSNWRSTLELLAAAQATFLADYFLAEEAQREAWRSKANEVLALAARAQDFATFMVDAAQVLPLDPRGTEMTKWWAELQAWHEAYGFVLGLHLAVHHAAPSSVAWVAT